MSHKIDFPFFEHHSQLIYLDSAATTQKPKQVIDRVNLYYNEENASVHRSVYELSIICTTLYEQVRESVKGFLNAFSSKEIIFTKGATDSLNLLAFSLRSKLAPDQEIIISAAEHHANLVPWQETAKATKCHLKIIPILENGELDLTAFSDLITPNTAIVSLTHCSNVLGILNPIHEVKNILSEKGSAALLIVDASQSVAHYPIDVQALGCDFLVFSAHKLYAPTGTGVLWGKEEHLKALPPYQTGGDMISKVTFENTTWNELPWKFEAGSPNTEGVIGLGSAISYLQNIGWQNIQSHYQELGELALQELVQIPDVKIIGQPDQRSGLISFTAQDIHPHDLADLLGQKNICIRAGYHCAEPLHHALNLNGSCRLSFGLYNEPQDVHTFISGLKEIIQDLKNA